MTIELEKQFFACFGIEPKKTQHIDGNGVFSNIIEEEYYPEITAEKLLQLICICSTVYPTTINYKETVDELKEFILGFCIRHSKELAKQVRKLFKE